VNRSGLRFAAPAEDLTPGPSPQAERGVAGLVIEARLVVELDDSSHRGRVDLDAQRDEFLLDHGERVLRLENEQVLQGIDSALARIAAMLPTR